MNVYGTQPKAAAITRLPIEKLRLYRKHLKGIVRGLGANRYDLLLPETASLPLLMQPQEEIGGIVYGHYKQDVQQGSYKGRGALVATSRRVLLIDHMPLFLKCIEYPYSAVSALSYGKMGITFTITLHSRVGNLTISTANRRAALTFITTVQSVIENDNKLGGIRYDQHSITI